MRIFAQAHLVFPDASASQAVVLRWYLGGLNRDLAIRKTGISAYIRNGRLAGTILRRQK